jgi:LysR family transcriptional regulator, transcription activator of glutamate synthase operon
MNGVFASASRTAASRAARSSAEPRRPRIARTVIDLRDVEFVDAVARHGNFTRAASDLHIAQPALSATIQRLEANLGVRLFDRTTRRVALTEAGDAFVARAKRILSEFGRLSEDMGEFAGGGRGILRVSWWYLGDPGLSAFLRTYRAANPGVEVVIAERSTADSLEAIRDGEAAIAAVALDSPIDGVGIAHRVIRREEFVLVTAPNRIDTRAVRLGQIREEGLIATRPGSGLRACLDRAFDGHGQPHIAIETETAASMIDLVAEDLGVAIVPRSVAEAARAGVALVPLEDSREFVLAAVWQEGRRTSAAQRAIDLLNGGGAAGDQLPEAVTAARDRHI